MTNTMTVYPILLGDIRTFSPVFLVGWRDRDVRFFTSIAKGLPRIEKLISATGNGKIIEEMEERARKALEWFTIKGNSNRLLINDDIDEDDTGALGCAGAFSFESICGSHTAVGLTA